LKLIEVPILLNFMYCRLKYLLVALTIASFNASAQKSQVLIARNAVGKLQASIANKENDKKQLTIITDGLKATESAEKDNRTKNWAEVWAIKSYLTSFASLIDTDPTNSERYFNLSVSAYNQAKSLDKYEDNSGLIKASHHNILIKKQDRGNLAFFNNNFNDAFEDLKDVSSHFDKDTTLILNTAICALNIQNYDEALKYFKKAKELKIKNPALYQRMAQIYSAKFDNENAIKALEDGLVLNPFNKPLTNDYINILLDIENYSKALSLIENNLKVEKGSKLLYFLYGYLQQINQNDATATIAYNKALSIDQNYFDALYQLSLAYINTANEILKKNDDNKTAQYNALINRAQFALIRANEINPNDRSSLQLLIEIYTRKNAPAKVQELKRRLQEL